MRDEQYARNLRLREYRNALGLTQEEVAEKLAQLAYEADGTEVHVNAMMVSNWERGLKRPRRRYRRLFCLLYHATEDELGLRPSASVPSGDEDEVDHAQLALLASVLAAFRALGIHVDRREFLTAFGVSAVGLLAGTQRSPHIRALLEGRGSAPPGSIDPGLVQEMEALTFAYRRCYRQLSVNYLLPQAIGHLQAASQLVNSSPPLPLGRRLITVIGRMSMLVGTLLLHDRGDAAGAAAYYRLSEQAAHQLGDQEMMAYLLGCLSFMNCYAGRRSEAITLSNRSQDLSARHASPRTRAWLNAVAAEMYATSGREKLALSALVASREALERADSADETWLGIGSFDHAKWTGYQGTTYLRLHRPIDAHPVLSATLQSLEPACVKHRCTAIADLATAMVAMDELDEGGRLAIEALDVAGQIEHHMTMRRISSLRSRMQRAIRSRTTIELDARLREISAPALLY